MANEWNKTASVEFETMLRRHLRSGAAPVSACAGFDLDAASEYLEGALDEWRRASYESHLAGCAICRRHLIELARLAQAAPSFESRPAVAPDRIPARDRWKEAVAGWFDLSTWNLKWKIAGASGVAFAILIAALGAQSWLYTYNHAERAIRGASATSAPSAESAAQPLPSPTPELSAPDAAAPGTQDLAVNSPARTEVTAPAPPVGPVVDAPKVAFVASSAARALIENQPPAAPVPANDNRLTAAERNAQRLSGRLEELSAVANTARGGAKAAQETADQAAAAPASTAPRSAETRQSPPPQTIEGGFVQINDISKAGESIFENRESPKAREANGTAGGSNISHPRLGRDLGGIKSGLSANRQSERPRPSKTRILPDIK
ncbi:MAG TPA: zf-HC2 domain-containing protein, partial [Blastocatellia bacterium]|nr:zf-HC2 domain-containing protein [Blastocatellia bacterium]